MADKPTAPPDHPTDWPPPTITAWLRDETVQTTNLVHELTSWAGYMSQAQREASDQARADLTAQINGTFTDADRIVEDFAARHEAAVTDALFTPEAQTVMAGTAVATDRPAPGPQDRNHYLEMALRASEAGYAVSDLFKFADQIGDYLEGTIR